MQAHQISQFHEMVQWNWTMTIIMTCKKENGSNFREILMCRMEKGLSSGLGLLGHYGKNQIMVTGVTKHYFGNPFSGKVIFQQKNQFKGKQIHPNFFFFQSFFKCFFFLKSFFLLDARKPERKQWKWVSLIVICQLISKSSDLSQTEKNFFWKY